MPQILTRVRRIEFIDGMRKEGGKVRRLPEIHLICRH